MPVFGGGASAGIGITSVVFPLDLPSFPAPRRISLGKHDTVGSARSPFSGVRQVQEWLAGKWWTVTVELPPMTAQNGQAWSAWFGALRGISGSFLIGDTANVNPRGVASGAPQVNGAGQTGFTLATKGWTPSTPLILRSGDKIQISSGLGTRYHENLTDVDSDSSGNATLNIWPALRGSPANGQALVTIAPKGLFCLSSNDRMVNIDEQLMYGLTFSAEEVL